jgi:hypothetical protein
MLQIGNFLEISLSDVSFESLGFHKMEDASAFVKPHPARTSTRHFGLLVDIQ